jgi:tetratricopeptide (TPR) repeat protein
MANKTSRRTVILGRPGENNEPREWSFVAHLRALGRQPDPARRAWEKTAKARGLAAARQGRLPEAIRLLELARSQTPWRDEEVEANLTELRAIRRLEKKLELRPNDAVALLTLGKAYFAQERGDDALDCFRRATKAMPSFAEAHAMMGLELHFRGDTAGAEAAYRAALRHQPGHQLAALYLKDLLHGDPPGGSTVNLEAEGRQAAQTDQASSGVQLETAPTPHEIPIAAG